VDATTYAEEHLEERMEIIATVNKVGSGWLAEVTPGLEDPGDRIGITRR
jgi:hypothetical protein